jgi:MFS family permease
MGMVYPSPAAESLTRDVNFTHLEHNIFNSIGFLASIFGPMLASFFLAHFGRRFAYRILNLLCFLSWMLLLLTPSAKIMCFISRFTFGLSLGGYFAVVPVYVMELSPPDRRGVYGTFNQLSISFGGFFCSLFGSFVEWEWLALISSVVPLCGFILSFWVPDSPVSSHDPALVPNIDESEPISLFGHMKPLVLGFLLVFFEQFSGIHPIQLSLSRLLKSKFGPAIAASSKCIAGFACVPLVEYLGRKNIWNLSCLGSCIALVCLIYSVWCENESYSVISTFAYLFCYCLGLGPIPLFAIPELFSDAIRASASSLLMTMNCLLSFIITFAYPYSVGFFGYYVTLLILAGFLLLGLVFGLTLYPEVNEVEPIEDNLLPIEDPEEEVEEPMEPGPEDGEMPKDGAAEP